MSDRALRRRQRLADAVGLFIGILAGLSVDSDDFLPRAIVAALVVMVAGLLLRFTLRVPLWRNVPDGRPPNLPPYGDPPVE